MMSLPRKEGGMAKDIVVTLENRPGQLASVGEALGGAGVNIEGICVEPQGEHHILVSDSESARGALEGAGITVGDERDVLVVDVEDRPGVLGETCRRLAEAGVNIEVAYLATGTRLVLGVDDMEKARGAV
jgi:hypothetical protein